MYVYNCILFAHKSVAITNKTTNKINFRSYSGEESNGSENVSLDPVQVKETRSGSDLNCTEANE